MRNILLEMKDFDQKKTPYVDAIKEYVSTDVTPFDVPGHHMGNIVNNATKLFGREVFRCDLNAPIGLDTLGNPKGVIYESSCYLAEACHADEAFFLINGTSGGIIAMIMTAVKANEKIILPRNVHKSIINALILSGAVPEYVMPEIDGELGIANQPSLAQWKQAILKNPSAKAVFVINPTYFGAVGPLREIVKFAHAHHKAVLVDEAHGAHYYFHSSFSPISAMDAGADMSSASFHKTAGSLTQSSVLLLKNGFFKREDVQKTLNILNTTSPSGLLIASVDAARSFMASKEGLAAMDATYELAKYVRAKIAKIPGFINEDKTHFLAHGSFDYDETKLVIGLGRLDIDGFELYHLLKEKYNIQVELAETNEILCIFSIGTKKKHVDNLVSALKEISKNHYLKTKAKKERIFESSFPFMIIRPRAAFHAPGKIVGIEECEGEISKEQVMMYPPGIPMIVPGEVWSRELVAKVRGILSDKESNVKLLSSYSEGFEIIDTAKWKRYALYQKRLDDYYENKITTPYKDGYHWPFEGDEHQETLMLLPFRRDTWRKKAVPATKAYAEVARAIAKHEPVVVGVRPNMYKKAVSLFQGDKNISLIKIKYDDAWARDNMPLFVTNGTKTRTVDFRFNAWGGDVDGLYSDYVEDDALGEAISKKMKLLSYYLPNFVLEGGSVITDGEGTLITTEACLLSKGRNPAYSKDEIEEILHEYLSVSKVIWVPHGIYQDETNEHIDNMVAFLRPGEVVMAWTDDKKDPQYKYCQKTYKALRTSLDAKERPLLIHKMPLPKPLYITKTEAKGLKFSDFTRDVRSEGRRLAASYINYYQGKDFIVMPAFGIKEDELALRKMKELYPDKEVHQIDTYEILLGGGNIHCITMQVPKENQHDQLGDHSILDGE